VPPFRPSAPLRASCEASRAARDSRRAARVATRADCVPSRSSWGPSHGVVVLATFYTLNCDSGPLVSRNDAGYAGPHLNAGIGGLVSAGDDGCKAASSRPHPRDAAALQPLRQVFARFSQKISTIRTTFDYIARGIAGVGAA